MNKQKNSSETPNFRKSLWILENQGRKTMKIMGLKRRYAYPSDAVRR